MVRLTRLHALSLPVCVPALVLGCLLLLAPRLTRAELLDQNNLIPASASPVVNAILTGQTRAQTFTVSAPGLLTHLNVQIYRQTTTTQTLILDLRRTTTAGAPTASDTQVLASLTLNASQLGTLPANPIAPPAYSWDVSALHIDVRAGDQLAIVARSSATTAANGYRWLTRTNSNLYAGGSAYLRTTGSFAAVAGDQGFQIYVEQVITFYWSGVVDTTDAEFTAGDSIVGKYIFLSNLSSAPGPTPDVDLQFAYDGYWLVAVPARGYRAYGSQLEFQTANDNPNPVVHDRYVTIFESPWYYVPFPSGRSFSYAQFDFYDHTTPDLLSSSALPLVPPNPALADQPSGRIVFTNNDQISFHVTSFSFSAPDSDGDSIEDVDDNCPSIWNSDQYDVYPYNGIGDACEDSDADGVSNDAEGRFLGTYPYSADSDFDGTPDALDVGTAPWCETVLDCPQADPNGDFCDTFGDSVALSGDTLVVGAPGYDGTNPDAGGAFVYQRSGTSWSLINTLTPIYTEFDGPYGRVGSTSAISGQTIVIGGRGPSSGGMYTYHALASGSLWVTEQNFPGAFVTSVSVLGDLLAAGGAQDPTTDVDAGAVTIHRRTTGPWALDAYKWPPTAQAFDHVGQSVAVVGDHVAVGAPGVDAPGTDAGEILMYDYAPATGWVLRSPVLASGSPGDALGTSLAADGTLIVAGAPFSDRFGTDSGSAQFYDRSGADWVPVGSLVGAPDVTSYSALGTSVALGQRTAAVGAPHANGGIGRAYVGRPGFGAGDWPAAELVPSLGASYDHGFGSSVAADGQTVAVGGAKRYSGGHLRGVVSIFDARPYSDPDCDNLTIEFDNCPWIYNPDQADGDHDAVGDACDTDLDNDGRYNWQDNCPLVKNSLQQDTDQDEVGDACDPDSDDDGLDNGQDNCALVSNPGQEDSDVDGVGDACEACLLSTDPDPDNDGVCDSLDNCAGLANPSQLDSDHDGYGDGCDSDRDGDGVPDAIDNCVATPNPDQLDSDVPHDGVGDVCDMSGISSCSDAQCSTPFGQAQYQPLFRFLLDPTSALGQQTQSSATSKGVCTIVKVYKAAAVISFLPSPGATGLACCAWEVECHGEQGEPLQCASTVANPPVLPYARLDGIHAYGVEPFSIGTGTPPPTYSDNDIFPDACDNCVYVENENQADTDHDGVGDACECGDVQGNGVTDAADVQALRNALASGTALPYPMNCNVVQKVGVDQPGSTWNHLPAGCNVADLAVFRRTVASLGPGLQQICATATGVLP